LHEHILYAIRKQQKRLSSSGFWQTYGTHTYFGKTHKACRINKDTYTRSNEISSKPSKKM